MTSKSSTAPGLNDDELEDGEIEDDLEEFNEYESLFQTSETSTSVSRKKSKATKPKRNNNSRRENDRGTSDRNRSHSSRTSHRRERSKSPSSTKSRRRTSPVPSKRSHSKRRTSSDVVDFAKGLRQKAESRLRRRKRAESPPKPTMRSLLLHQRHPAHLPPSQPRKKRSSSEMEEYEQLLQKHREVQELIQRAKSNLKDDKPGHKRKSRSRSRSGSQTDSLERLEQSARKQNANDIIEMPIEEVDDEMDLLQLRMAALKSATRAVAAREEKENKEEALEETKKEKGVISLELKATTSSPSSKLSQRARQEERKQKLLKWKKQHSLTVEINKVTDEKSRYELFMDHVTRGPDAGNKRSSPKTGQQNGNPSSTFQPIASSQEQEGNDSDSDVQEIPITPSGMEEAKETIFQSDNYEAVEMELDTEESGFTPPIPGISDGPDIELLLMKEIEKTPHYTTISSQPPPPGVSPLKHTDQNQTERKPVPDEAQAEEAKEDEDDEEDMLALRQLLLQSMASKRAAKKQQEKEDAETKVAHSQPSVSQLDEAARVTASKGQGSPQVSSGTVSPVIASALKQLRQAATAKSKPTTKPKIPVHKPIIIRPGDDSDSSDDERNTGRLQASTSQSLAGLSGIELFLKEARKTADKVKSTTSSGSHNKELNREPTTPEAMSKLPDSHQAEYQRLKQEIVRREQQKHSSSRPSSGTASPDPSVISGHLPKTLQVTIKSGSKSATASPDRNEVRLVALDGKQQPKDQPLDKEQEVNPSTSRVLKSDTEDASIKEQQRQELLRKEQAQKKEIRACTEKMLKHRQAIQKGHKLLSSLDLQVDRKCKLLNLMQGRVSKLQEELLAAQKTVSFHQDQVNKFKEQKQQVRIRLEKHVSEEKQLSKKIAAVKGVSISEISQSAASSQMNVNATKATIGAKRPLEPSGNNSQANKKSRGQGGAAASPAKPKSEAKLQELQRLEKAYAQKIEQLREAQAKKAQVKMSHLSPAASRLMRTRKSTPNVKPAKQVYLKDKIALGSNSGSSGDEGPSRYKRRKSWLNGQNPTLKPNLFETGQVMITQKQTVLQKPKQPASPVPTRHGAKRTSNGSLASPSKEGRKQDKGSKTPPEPIVEGLYMPNTQQLKLLQQIQAEKSQRGIDFLALAQCFDALQRQFVKEDGADGCMIETTMQEKEDGNMEEAEEKAEDFPLEMYTSPLIPFKAYRFSPHFEVGAHMTRHSNTVSNKIHPLRPFCKYELNGKCNDEECPWQHERDYLLKELELYEDLSSYMQLKTPTNSSSESTNSNSSKIEKEFEKMKKLVEKEKGSGRIDVQRRKTEMGKVCVERVRKHYQNKGISVLLEPSKRPKTYLKSTSRGENPSTYLVPRALRRQPISKPNTLCLEDTDRYFFATSEGVVDIEAAVLEKPKDIELWLKLAYKQLTDDSSDKSLDKALYALCRGLESNKNNSELWLHYLTLYELRDKHPDLLQLCQQAVEFAPNYEIWWKYLTLKPSFSEKDAECEKLLQFVIQQQKEDKTDMGSHRLLETLLYRVQLHITTRRINQGLTIFQDALREYSITSLSRHLLPADRCLAWLSYLHVMGFHCLPPSLYIPATGALGRLVSKEPFMFPWEHADSSRLSESLITGFQDALLSCSSSQLPIEDSIEICLPIYRNLFTMEAKLDRLNKAQSVCRHLLHDCPSSSELWLCLVDIEKKNKSSVDNIAKVFKEAISGCPTSAELYYCAAKFELEQDNKDEAIQYLRQCVIKYYELDTNSTELNTQDIVNLYRSLLDQHLPFDYKPPSWAAGITSEVVQHNLLHLWSCYCLYLEKLEGHNAASEAYETGLCALKKTRDVQKLWIQYLEYQKSQIDNSNTQSWKVFSDLVNRCLISMPTVWPLHHASTETWRDFSFHNCVLELYFGCIRREDAGDAFEQYLNRMPQNISLAFRACQHSIEVGSEFQAQLIARVVLSDHPTCISFWKIAIALCVKNGQTKEAHQMYQRAVEACPLSASLWKDYLLFEVTRGKGRDDLKKLILRCRDDIGLNINDYLATIFKT